jgi:CubicO group peptidase (beta-lactamase class C family)
MVRLRAASRSRRECLTAFLALGMGAGAPGRRSAAVFPGAEWLQRTPEQEGLRRPALEAFSAYVEGRGCIVRHGRVVHTWGDQAKREDVASACKPVLAHFLLKAVEEGKIATLDSNLAAFEPRLNGLNQPLGFKDRMITWRHLVNQISCYGSREQPGRAFDYNDYNFALFFDTLFLKVYGTTWSQLDADILHPMLTKRLQCQDHPTFMAFGLEDRPGRLGMSVRDFARFGLLYLRGGEWKGEQLLRGEHVVNATTSPLSNEIPRTEGEPAEMIPSQRTGGGGRNQTDHLGSYSYMWWTNGVGRTGQRLWPDAPGDAYCANGHFGPRALWVIPSLDLVVSYNSAARLKSKDWTSGPDTPTNRAMRLLMRAVVKEG